MIKKLFYITLINIAILFLFCSFSFAGNAKIDVYHVEPDLKVVKFNFLYGRTVDSMDSLVTIIIDPEVQTTNKSLLNVGLEGDGVFYIKVKDFYEDDSEGEYSEPFELNIIPKLVIGLDIK